MCSLEPLADRFAPSAGRSTRSTATTTRRSSSGSRGGCLRPRVVVAHTVKGYGVPLLEGEFMSHYRSFRPHERDLLFAGLDERQAAA